MRFDEGELPEVYVIPFEVWKKPQGMFVYHDYKKPEYGMNCSGKNMPHLEKNDCSADRLLGLL